MSATNGAHAATALDGIRVVEIASELGAFAGKLLADLGADVICVEPLLGSPTRGHEPFRGDIPDSEGSLHWWHYNTSKRGVTLDLESDAGRDCFRRLVGTADMLLECEPPARIKALGLDHETLAGEHSELITVSITPFGQKGTERDDLVTDLTLLAEGGPVWSCGYDDHNLPPIRGAGNQGYQTACHYAVMSALTAILIREGTGLGQHIDVNAHAACNVTTEMASYHWLVSEGTVQRQTGRHAMEFMTLPTQIECADGRHATTGVPPRSPAEFATLYEWIVELGLVEEFPEAIFIRMGAERERIDLSEIGKDDELTAIFGAAREALNFIASKVSAYDFFEGAQKRGITVGVIYSPEEAMEDEHFRARGFPVEVEHEAIGATFTYPGAPYVFEKTPWRIACPAPRLGEHNQEIFGELGLSLEEIDALGFGDVR